MTALIETAASIPNITIMTSTKAGKLLTQRWPRLPVVTASER